jgi:hypothetical protein
MLFNELILNSKNFVIFINHIYFLAALKKVISLSFYGADVSTIYDTIDNFLEKKL